MFTSCGVGLYLDINLCVVSSRYYLLPKLLYKALLSGTMTESSAEYRAMIDLTSELRLAVRPELIFLTGSLPASRLISPDNDIELRDTAHSGEVERSARLVELVQNKVRQNPRHYHSFTGILQGNENQYRDILQQLEQAYQEQRSQDGNYDNYQ